VNKEGSDGKTESGTIQFNDMGSNSFLEIFGRTTIGDGCDNGAFAITCIAKNPNTEDADTWNPWYGFRSDLNHWKVKSGLTSSSSRYDMSSMETPCNSESGRIAQNWEEATTSYKNLWSVEADAETLVVFKGSPYTAGEGSLQSNAPVDVGLLKGFKLPITAITREIPDGDENNTEAVRDSCQDHLEHGITEDGVYKVKQHICYCEFKILSVDHSSGTDGTYFNFDAQNCGRSDLVPAGTYRVRQLRKTDQGT